MTILSGLAVLFGAVVLGVLFGMTVAAFRRDMLRNRRIRAERRRAAERANLKAGEGI